ncbi:MAG: peroxiredoxin [Candidatus Methanomethylophilaceae archaeon]|nr:peroxiredoxin [Candidatus Methanomethylophilaceae archaeon]
MEIGERFPDYVLTDDTGAEFDSRSMAGKRYVLYFYPKDNTGGCTTEAKEFTAASPDLADIGVEVIGVSRDSTASHQRFKEKQGLGIRLLTDADHTLMEKVGAWGLKTNYGKTFEGVKRTTFIIGKDGNVEAVWNNVKVAGHVAKVVEKARSLQ